MKNVSEIASALRAQGRKFNQAALAAALQAKCTPVYKHGRAHIYDDSTIADMLQVSPIHKLEYVVNASS